jgi:1-acyl-sn-glycerol-3-phosphate acyltransferase
MDILIAQSIFFPSFVAKSSVRKYPFVGNIAAAIDCLFVDSASTKE